MDFDTKRAEISNLATWETDQAHAVAMIEPYLLFGGSVLDYGCGVGRIMKPLATKHFRTQFWGYDIDTEALDYARLDQRTNEHYSQHQPLDIENLRSVYSVITFQHMPDEAVARLISWWYPIRFRFQFATGTIQMDYNYQRNPEQVEAWCTTAGYKVDMMDDPVNETWQWVTCS